MKRAMPHVSSMYLKKKKVYKYYTVSFIINFKLKCYNMIYDKFLLFDYRKSRLYGYDHLFIRLPSYEVSTGSLFRTLSYQTPTVDLLVCYLVGWRRNFYSQGSFR